MNRIDSAVRHIFRLEKVSRDKDNHHCPRWI